jgi:dephospho-CoA kinase
MASRLRIGLTGGIASGKSTVAREFAELGVPIIDADEISREVVEPGTSGLQAVVRRFGKDILAADGRLDRRRLRQIVFAQPAARRDLEELLHPLIRAQMQLRSDLLPGPYQIFVIPLLVETGLREGLDRILVVDTDEEAQVQRLMSRDQESALQARAILGAQAPRRQRLQAADDVITNTGSLADLQQAVARLHAQYLSWAAIAP